jgi:hypothetical protein
MSYLTEKRSKLRSFDMQWRRPKKCIFLSSFTQRTAQFTHGIPQFPKFTCRHHDGITSRHSTFHPTIYPFPNTTSYCTFYTFFSSFLITLWPMWLAKSKRQPCFYPPQSHAQEDTQNWQKNWQTWWETCAVPENIQFSFSHNYFYSVKLRSLT